MQAHLIPPRALAENARKVAGYGAQSITIMDSTGTLIPSQVKEYVEALVKSVEVPVGFHGHNNLGFSVANAIAALDSGAASVDGALGGLARSAGNAPTEMLCAVLEKQGRPTGIDWYRLLDFIDRKFSVIVPDLKGIPPLDIIYGYAGFHSRNLATAKSVASSEGVNLYRLIVEVSRYGKPNPDEDLFKKAAAVLKK
jgi:4-hydroxy-2-oxovalerate aldolase